MYINPFFLFPFIINSSDDFSPVSLKINNLGADATRPDGSDYKLTPKYSSCQFDAFDSVYNLIK